MNDKKEKLLNKNNSSNLNKNENNNNNYVKIIPDFKDEEESFNNINISSELLDNKRINNENKNKSNNNITFIFNNTNNISNSIIINKNDLNKNNENFFNRDTIINLNSIIKDNSKLCVFVSSNKNSKTKIFKDEEFALVEDENLTTYFHGNKFFSKINNVEKIENENKDIIKFLLPKNIYDKNNNPIKGFNENDINLNVNKEQFSVFIRDINNFINAENYKNIETNFHKKIKKFITIIILLSIFLLIDFVLIFVLSYNLSQKNYILFLCFAIVFMIFGIFFLLYSILFLKNKNFLLIKKKFFFMEKKKDEIEKFVFKWNKTFFNEKDINLEIPILFDYILFNMNFSKYEVYINPYKNPLLLENEQMNINLNYLK